MFTLISSSEHGEMTQRQYDIVRRTSTMVMKKIKRNTLSRDNKTRKNGETPTIIATKFAYREFDVIMR